MPHPLPARPRAAAALRPLLGGLFAVGCAGHAPAAPAPAEALAITHVTVIDVAAGRPMPDMTVELSGGHIVRVRPSAEATPSGRIVDGRGGFLIPGLWDMHAGVLERQARDFPLLLANGVTGVRVMSTRMPLPDIAALRREVERGAVPGPRFISGGPPIGGPGSSWPCAAVARSEADGRRLVDSLQRAGADFISVTDGLSTPVYLAIATEAERAGLPLAGLVPAGVGVAGASDAGQRSIEHLWRLLGACSPASDSYYAAFDSLSADTARSGEAVSRAKRDLTLRWFDTISESYCAPLFARFKANGTWQVPTLVTQRTNALFHDQVFVRDPRRRYMTADLPAWNADSTPYLAGLLAIPPELRKRRYAIELQLVGALQRAGVGILAGTGVGEPFLYTGSSLHDELELLVESGLSPAAALRAATLSAAEFMGATDSLGTVAEGKLADVVLLDADPLADIGAVAQIRAVVAGGRLFDRQALDRLLAVAMGVEPGRARVAGSDPRALSGPAR
jgi:hypothetical protein